MVKIKAIIKHLIIAFFFSSLAVLITLIVFGKTIDKGLSMINTVSLGLDYGSNENVSFDKVSKRLTVQPSWGTVFGRLKIPSISVDLPIYHGDDTEQLVDGAGHYAGSWFPGEGASIILAAHNSHGLFYTLPQIQKGDRIRIETIYGNFDYEVYYTDIRDYRDREAFPIQDQEEILMLYTCYPVDNVWYVNERFIAYARLVGDKSE
ncbi:MAG: class D sortase [Bacilli bacterium]|nr:class D sortase [Bacilli bacterium]